MHPYLRGFVLVALAGLLGGAPEAEAQRAGGPYAGLFGGDEANQVQGLDLRASLFGAVDDVLTIADEPAVDRRFLESGFAGGAQAGLFYSRSSNRVQLQSSAASVYRMYAATSDGGAATLGARTAFDAQLTTRVSVAGTATGAYSPYYALAPGIDIGSGGWGFDSGFVGAAARNSAAAGEGGLSVRLTRRSTLSATVTGRQSEFLDQPYSTVKSWGAGGTVRHALTRTLAVRAGYRREEGTYRFGDADRFVSDSIDAGLEYGDTLRFSRRTAVSFRSSTVMLRDDADTHYRVNASAALTRAIGRFGSAAARYTRDTEFVAGYRAPLLSDTVSAGVGNQIGRRAYWTAGAGYKRGTAGWRDDVHTFRTYQAGSRLTVAVTRNVGVYGQYAYHRHEIPEGATVFAFLPMFSRQTASVGLTLWTPLFRDTRSPGDTR